MNPKVHAPKFQNVWKNTAILNELNANAATGALPIMWTLDFGGWEMIIAGCYPGYR